MRAGAEDSIQGRCPTCGQVVILSVAVRVQLVECPRCGHRGTGAVFVDIEAPLPVVLVEHPDPPRSTSETPGRRAAWSEALPDEGLSDEAPSDEALLDEALLDEAVLDEAVLDEAVLDEALSDAYDAALSSVRATNRSQPGGATHDERTLLMGDERTLLMGDERTLLMGDERTLLMLESPFLKHERGTGAQAPASRSGSARVKGPAGDDERTHLLLDPLDLRDERDTPLTRMTARLRPFAERVLELGWSVDERLYGRWTAAFAILGAACGILPPSFDYLTDDPGSTAGRIADVLIFASLAAFILAWFGTLRRDDGVWDVKVAAVRVQTTTQRLLEEVGQIGRSPRYLKLQLCGELLAALGLISSGLAACRSMVRMFLGASDPPSLLRFTSGLLLVGGAVLLRAAQRATPKAAPGPAELAESLEAARQLPPIIDLSLPLPRAFDGEDTALHRVVLALSEWRDRACFDEAGYRVALARHLQRQLPTTRVERGRQLGRSRRDGVADLIVGDLVLIEVKHGFRQHSAERALARLNGHARTWPGKPLLLAIFDASREAVFDGAATPALVELHERLSTLTVRMPARR